MSGHKLDQRGFTIIEMIVTTGVASLMLFASYYLMIGAIRSARQAENRTAASNLATKKIEEIRKQNYDNVCPRNAVIPADPNPCITTDPAVTINTFAFTLTTRVTEVVTSNASGDTVKRKDLLVTVTWRDPQNKTFRSETTITPYTTLATPG